MEDTQNNKENSQKDAQSRHPKQRGIRSKLRRNTARWYTFSPMLANIALTVLDEWGETQRNSRNRRNNPIVRYADDFVLVCHTEEEAKRRKEEIKHLLREEIGLSLSEEKTRITNIHEGFNFLGFHIRKYRKKSPHSKYHETGQLLIKPQKEKTQAFLKECTKTIRSSRGQSLKTLILKLNPKLQGFANYYRFVVSKETYRTISDAIWDKVYRFCCKSHPNKSKKWVRRRYRTEYGNGRKTETLQMHGERLYKPIFIPITRYAKVKSGMRVYDNSKETRVYWENRAYKNSLNSIYSLRVEKLFKRQDGLCPICRKAITEQQIRDNALHQHHLNPQSKSDDHRLTNLRLIHDDCHRELHSILSLEEMFFLAESGIDYCDKNYLYETYV